MLEKWYKSCDMEKKTRWKFLLPSSERFHNKSVSNLLANMHTIRKVLLCITFNPARRQEAIEQKLWYGCYLE